MSIPLDLRAQPDLGSPFGGVPRVKDLGKKQQTGSPNTYSPKKMRANNNNNNNHHNPKKTWYFAGWKGGFQFTMMGPRHVHLRGWRQTIRFLRGYKWMAPIRFGMAQNDEKPQFDQMWYLWPRLWAFFQPNFEPGPPFWNQHQASGYSKVPAFVNFNGHASWDKHVGHTSYWTCMHVKSIRVHQKYEGITNANKSIWILNAHRCWTHPFNPILT